MNEIKVEIRNALVERPKTLIPGTCLAFNDAIPKLEQHGIELLPAVESVVSEIDYAPHHGGNWWRVNLSELLKLYFRIGDDHDWNTAPFVKALPTPVFTRAVTAVLSVWGTNNDERRTVMPKHLFDCLNERLPPDDSLLITLNRLIKIGQLTFDRDNRGKRAPQRLKDPPEIDGYKYSI